MAAAIFLAATLLIAALAAPSGAAQLAEIAVRSADIPADELASRPPAEPPPDDLPGGQYIDSAGCVFVRTPAGWRARIARDGSSICGYPPTFSARRTGPDLLTPLISAPEEPRDRRIARVLTETIIGNLDAAELAAAAPPAVPAPPPPAAPPPAGPAPADPGGMAAILRAAPAVSVAVATARTDRLCEKLGRASRPVSGSGVSVLGFCGAIREPLTAGGPQRLASAAAPAAEAVPNASPRAEAPRRAAVAAKAAQAARKPAVRPGRGGVTAPGGKAEPMIPAGARFVQVGAFGDPGNAARAARRLAELGFPVAKSRQGERDLIMVGPLQGREAVVRAIHRLRGAGFPGAVARR